MSIKVAILQNQLRLGGRSKVVCELMDVLNKKGIIPDVFSFTPDKIAYQTGKFFDFTDLKFNNICIFPNIPNRGWLIQIPLLHLSTNHLHKYYDIVFNSNNTAFGLSSDAHYIHYIHYPLGENVASIKRSSIYQGASVRALYGILVGSFMGYLHRSGFPKGLFIANSDFTRDAVEVVYPSLKNRVKVIYPPSFKLSDMKSLYTNRNLYQCVSVGSISPHKRQIIQIEIAEQLPNIHFYIIGSIKSYSYYKSCMKLIQEKKLENVQILTDISLHQLKSLLHSSAFFLHTKIDEHFGISTVEAIAAGCIPITHDSGGQREVVPIQHLRYQTLDEAISSFRSLLSNSSDEKSALRKQLQDNILQFSREKFRISVLDLLDSYLNVT